MDRIILIKIWFFLLGAIKALEFYTETLGFVKKHDVPVGITTLPPKSIKRRYLPMASQQQCLALQI